MFIAIANVDHDHMLNNCNITHLREYWTETDNPVFMAMTFERACEAIKQYYRALDDDVFPDYAIYEISGESWTVAGQRTITVDIACHNT